MSDQERLLQVLAAMSNPHRLRLLARLHARPGYVSQLARDLGVSRPLLHMHLDKLEKAGLITGHLELSTDGKALKVYQLEAFHFVLNAETISAAIAASDDQPPADSPTGTQPGAAT